MKRILCIVLLTLFSVFIFTGCDTFTKVGFKEASNDELAPVSSIVISENEAQSINNRLPVHLYFADENTNKLKLEIRYLPIEDAKSTSNLASKIVEELIKGPSEKSTLKATLPASTKLCAPVSFSEGVATVNLSKELVDQHPGGKAAEQLTIYSLVNSLTELKEVQKVKFLIEGKQQKEFKGNFKFDNMFPRTTSIINREV